MSEDSSSGIGMRRWQTYTDQKVEQRNGKHRNVISQNWRIPGIRKACDARAAALAIIGQRARGEPLTGAERGHHHVASLGCAMRCT